MADIKLLKDVDSLDLEAAIIEVVNGDSDDFLEFVRTLGLDPLKDLKGRDLSGIRVEPGSDLRSANLERANLRSAFLRGAVLNGAVLNGAVLSGADLSRANLSGANLSRADLRGANLIGANLSRANLEGAVLNGAVLRGANFKGAQRLTTAQVKAAKNWQSAHYDPDFRQQLGLPPEEP